MFAARMVLLFISAVLSCGLFFLWLRQEKKQGILLSLVAGLVCMVISGAGEHYLPGGDLSLPALLMVCSLSLYQREEHRISDWMAVLLAGACYGALSCVVKSLLLIPGASLLLKISLILFLLAFIAWTILYFSNWFPEEYWQESFQGEAEKFAKIRISLGLVYGQATLWCAVCIGFPYLCGESLLLAFLLVLVFFLGLSVTCLMIGYSEESAEVLLGKQQKNDLQTFMNIIRSQRHDYNFHVQTLQTMLRESGSEICQNYLNELLADSVKMNQLLPLADPAISALIYSFRDNAKQLGIDMDISIENDLAKIATNVYDTNKIIGNLLQNAIDETVRLADKSYGIKLSIIKRGEYCMILVSNRITDPKGLKNYQVGVSAKAGHEGIGLASIRSLTKRYRGTVYSRLEGDIVQFIAKIPLRVV